MNRYQKITICRQINEAGAEQNDEARSSESGAQVAENGLGPRRLLYVENDIQ